LDHPGFPGAYLLDLHHIARHPRHLKFNCRPVISPVRSVAHSLWLNGAFPDPARRRLRRLRKVLRAVHADNVRITLYLFKARSAPAAGDIANVFINSPHQDNDGEYFYGVLPAPSRPAKLTLPRLRTESRL